MTSILDYQAPSNLLQERVILVTGAGDGIGRAVAIGAAAHGATVILLGRTISKLEKVYDSIVEADHPEPAIYPMNLEGAAWKDYEDLSDKLGKEFGHLDGLVHNAAFFHYLTPLAQHDVEIWLRTLHVNLTVPFLLTRVCLPLLQAAPAASVIFVGDDVSRHGEAYWGAYGASKSGLEGLMQTFADEIEVNTRIRANSLNPGPVRTAMRRRVYPDADADAGARAPQDVAPAFLYLLGNDSEGISGRSLRVDCSLTALQDSDAGGP